MRYRKRPVEIDAWRVRELSLTARDNWDDLPDQVNEAQKRGQLRFVSEPHMFMEIITLEGIMRADIDDMLIMGIKGEFYPCKPDIFFESYEEVTE